jgi:hypothetical protein
LDGKPDFKSYIKQFSVTSYTVRDSGTGVIYEEMNAKAHRILWTLFFILMYGLIAFFLISILPVTENTLIIAIYIISAFLLAAAYYVFLIWAVYKASRFKVIGEEEINNYLDTRF